MIHVRVVVAVALSVGVLSGPIEAQDPNYTISITDGVASVGTTATVSNILDDAAGNDLSGWSWGQCQGAEVDIVSVEPGLAIVGLNGGAGPDFNAPAIFAGAGWTIGVVVNFLGLEFLPPGDGQELHTSTYVGLAKGVASLDYCGTLGDPLVQITLVDSGGGSIIPVQMSGMIEVVEMLPPFIFGIPDQSVEYEGDTGIGSFVSDFTVLENPDNPSFPTDTQAFSMAVAHDDTLLTITGVNEAPVLGALNDGDGPAFFGVSLAPTNGAGFTLGCVYVFLEAEVLQFPSATPVITGSYELVAASLAGNPSPTITPLSWTNDLGEPVVINTVVVDNQSQPVTLESGAITLIPIFDEPFIRGDCNESNFIDIADGIFLLDFLFQMGPEAVCFESCNINDDGAGVDQSDAVYLFNYLFLSGPQPPAPFPDCGTDPGADCEGSSNCP